MNDKLRIDEALKAATSKLAPVSDSPRLDAELLLARALDVQRSYLFAHPDDRMDRAAAERYSSAIKRRTDGVPLAYITGEKEFWSMPFAVSPATLVPRPETELLVECALMRIPIESGQRILDLGTGSGVIGLTIAKERPISHVVAAENSIEALAVARENARRLGISNVEFTYSNWFEALGNQTFDLIVSNPPYVPRHDPDLTRLTHEPLQALVAGDDGFDAIRHIAGSAIAAIKPGGPLLMEHGDRQADEVAEILRCAGWRNIELMNDLAGRPRVTIANL